MHSESSGHEYLSGMRKSKNFVYLRCPFMFCFLLSLTHETPDESLFLKLFMKDSVMVLGRLPGCAFYESLTCLLHMRMMFACRLVTVPSWPPSFSVRSSQSRSYNRYRIFGTRSSNNISGLVPIVGHCASFENRFIPVPSFEVSS